MTRQTLRQLADRRNFLIGAACSPGTIDSEADYRRVLAREFNCKGEYDEGLPFDRNCRPKPAYHAIRKALSA